MRPENNLALYHARRTGANIDNRSVLVNPSIIAKNSVHFNIIGRLMVSRKANDLTTTVYRHTSSTVTSVAYVTHVIDNEGDDGT